MYQVLRYYNNNIVLNNLLRKLWEQHIMWTRSFIISTVDNLGDLEFVEKRLLQNPYDFAEVLRTYYGDEKADEFARLLEEHLQIAGELLNQAKAGNTQAADNTRQRWYENAAEIAAFLAEINPYWSEEEWNNMLNEHLKITEQEADTRLKKQYEENVALYDDIEAQALAMADYMTVGILKQLID